MKLIEVTSKVSGEKIYINPEHICSIVKSGEDSATISLVNKEQLLIEESCTELIKKCNLFIKRVHCKWIDKQGDCWFHMPDSKRPCTGKDCGYFEDGDGVRI